MLGHMTEELSKKTLRSYAKLGEDMGLWTSHEQSTLNSKGESTQRIIIEWDTTEKKDD